jgi:hypothetical protein
MGRATNLAIKCAAMLALVVVVGVAVFTSGPAFPVENHTMGARR